jgi:hypothetical protein
MYKQEKRECRNEECKKEFIAKVYNAAYCSVECRRLITNKKLLDKYYQNKENICEQCKGERFIKRLVSWGYDEEKLRKEV